MAKKAAAKKPLETDKIAKLAKPGKYVYFFGDGKADGDRTMKDLLGGKGSGLAEMTNAKLPVPAGFTISTPVCSIYYKEGGKIPASIEKEMIDNLRKLEKSAGRKLGDTRKPLLVSVRSGAKFSMPGMMDTILNLGLNDETVETLKAETGNGRFAADSYRRFIQMFGNVVLEIGKDVFEHELDAVKKARGAKADTDLDEAALRDVIARYKQVLSAGPDRAAQGLAQRRVPILAESPRHRVPPHLRHSRLHRHGCERPADGVRQYGRSVGDGRRIHAEPGHRREGVLRRVPD
jgi:pyruvate,orthophosphate dikinase